MPIFRGSIQTSRVPAFLLRAVFRTQLRTRGEKNAKIPTFMVPGKRFLRYPKRLLRFWGRAYILSRAAKTFIFFVSRKPPLETAENPQGTRVTSGRSRSRNPECTGHPLSARRSIEEEEHTTESREMEE
jgi:hypothetical protein